MNRWDKRCQRESEPRDEIARVRALRDRMASELSRLHGKLEGIEAAIAIVGAERALLPGDVLDAEEWGKETT